MLWLMATRTPWKVLFSQGGNGSYIYMRTFTKNSAVETWYNWPRCFYIEVGRLNWINRTFSIFIGQSVIAYPIHWCCDAAENNSPKIKIYLSLPTSMLSVKNPGCCSICYWSVWGLIVQFNTSYCCHVVSDASQQITYYLRVFKQLSWLYWCISISITLTSRDSRPLGSRDNIYNASGQYLAKLPERSLRHRQTSALKGGTKGMMEYIYISLWKLKTGL